MEPGLGQPCFLEGIGSLRASKLILESMPSSGAEKLSRGNVQLWDHWTKWLKVCCCSLETMIICAYTYPIVFPVHFRKPSHWYLKIYILLWRLQLWLRAKSTTPSQVDSWSHVPHVLWGQHSRINQSLYPCQFFFWQVFPTSFSRYYEGQGIPDEGKGSLLSTLANCKRHQELVIIRTICSHPLWFGHLGVSLLVPKDVEVTTT